MHVRERQIMLRIALVLTLYAAMLLAGGCRKNSPSTSDPLNDYLAMTSVLADQLRRVQDEAHNERQMGKRVTDLKQTLADLETVLATLPTETAREASPLQEKARRSVGAYEDLWTFWHGELQRASRAPSLAEQDKILGALIGEREKRFEQAEGLAKEFMALHDALVSRNPPAL